MNEKLHNLIALAAQRWKLGLVPWSVKLATYIDALFESVLNLDVEKEKKIFHRCHCPMSFYSLYYFKKTSKQSLRALLINPNGI